MGDHRCQIRRDLHPVGVTHFARMKLGNPPRSFSRICNWRT